MHLLACTDCRRPYDVTRLDPGSHVRCICDTLLEVPFRAPLSVEALCCRHCGGAVGASDPECTFCGCALSETDRMRGTLCPYCFKRLDDDSRHCSHCGTDIAPQALSPLPAEVVDGRGRAKTCPRCRGELRLRMVGRLDLIECAACEGLWLEPERFEAVCRTARAGGRESLFLGGAPPREVGSPPGEGYIPCLRCDELMLRKQFRASGRGSGVVTDVCKDHGVWLDGRELERIVGFLEQAPDPEPQATGSLPPLTIDLGTRRPDTGQPRVLEFLGDLAHWLLDR